MTLRLVICSLIGLSLKWAGAQTATIALGSGSGIPGGTVDISVSLASTGGAQPSALNFTVTHPFSDLSTAQGLITPGGSVTAAGKTLTCSLKTGLTVCVVAGISPPNSNVIPNGLLGTIRYQIAQGIAPGPGPKIDTLAVTGVTVSDAAGRYISSGGSGGTVSISASPPPPPPTVWNISGAVGVGGANVRLSGAAQANMITPPSGIYSFNGLAAGNYVVTPSKSRCSFTPFSQAVTLSNASVTLNFTASGRRCR